MPRCLSRTARSSGVGAELFVRNRNGVPVEIKASTNSPAPGINWFSRYRTPSMSIKYPVFIVSESDWRSRVWPRVLSYSENEIGGNARPHPGPLPQEREEHAQVLGVF